MVAGVRAAGVQPVIYTGRGIWPSIAGTDAYKFSSVPLWDTDATYDRPSSLSASLSTPTPQAYGGWNVNGTMRVGVQQYFEYNLNGVKVDINSFDRAFLDRIEQ